MMPRLRFSDLLGVPYLHRGRDPCVGLDCLGVLLEVYHRLGIELEEPPIEYAEGWAQAGEDHLHDHFPRMFRPIPAPVEVGDVVLSAPPGGAPQHILVLAQEDQLLHVDRGRGVHVVRWRWMKDLATTCYRYGTESVGVEEIRLESTEDPPPMVTVRVVERIFEMRGRRSWEAPWRDGATVADYFPEGELARPSCQCVHARLGLQLSPTGWGTPVAAGDELLFVQYPSEPFSLGILLSFLGEAALTGAFAVGEVALFAGAAFGAAYLAQRIMGTPRPERSLLQSTDPTYTFNGVETRAEIGGVVPIVVGRHPVGGNIVGLSTRGIMTDEPTTDPRDNRLFLLLALGQGPIAGIDEVLVNGNPITNYRGVLENRLGTPDQTPITGSASNQDTKTNIAVGLALNNPNDSGPAGDADILVQRTNKAIDAFYVNVFHPQGLYSAGPALLPMFTEWSVSYKLAAAPDVPASWSAWENVWVERAIRGPFVSTTKFAVASRAIYDVRVRRVKPFTTDATNIDDIEWDSLVESLHEEFSHPGHALLALSLYADEGLNAGVPDIAVIERGIVTERWDGVDPDNPTFVPDSPDYSNPAWFILTMLRSSDWGLGAYVDAEDIDLQSFKDWADWCNELVDDGAGGLEKRCTFNGVFNGGESAWAAVIRVCFTARATILVVGNTIKAKFEHDRDVTETFTMATIGRGSFKISYLSDSDLPTRTEVRFLNEDLDWTVDVAGVDDPIALAEGRPQIVETLDMFGITRASQAKREARFQLNLRRLATTLVEFETTVNAIGCEPKDLVYVQHDLPQWGLGGRLQAATSTTVTFDQDVVLAAGKSYEVLVHVSSNNTPQIRLITSVAGSYPAGAALTVSEAFNPVPAARDQYVLGLENLVTRTVMISSIVRTPDLRARITGIVWDPRINDDSIDRFDVPVISTLPDPVATPACPPPPTAVEQLEPDAGGGSWRSVLDVSWVLPDPEDQVVSYARVYMRDKTTTPPTGFENGYALIAEVPAPATTYRISSGLAVGCTYEVVVILVSPGGSAKTSYDCTGTIVTVKNLGLLPGKPQNFAAVRSGTEILLSWDPVPNATGYEIRRGGEWGCSVLVGELPGNATTFAAWNWAPSSASVGAGEERFHIRAIGPGGLYGPSAKIAMTLSPWFDPAGSLVLASRDEQGLNWPGTLTNLEVNAGRLRLVTKTSPGTYETPAILFTAGDTTFRAGLYLWCSPQEGPTLNSLAFSFNSPEASQLSFNGPIPPDDWPYSVKAEIRFAATSGGLASAAYEPFDTILDVVKVSSVSYLQIRLTVATTAADWEAYVEEMYLTVENAP